jgi:short-subunit dehydrogenase
VGISSISGLRGRANNIAYSATKAYASNYLQGCRQRAAHLKKAVAVTDLIPGYVATRLIKGHSGTFWVTPVDKAARQMVKAILRHKRRAYITRRWRLVAWFLTLIPDWLHQKL